MPGSCEHPDSLLSRSPSSTFAESPNFDMDDRAFRTNDRNDFFGFAFQLPSLGTDVAIQSPRQCLGGSRHLCAVSMQKNNGWSEKWESPGATPPPASSSPDLDSSPASTHSVFLATTQSMDVTTGRPLSVLQRGGGRSSAKALFNDHVDSSTFVFSTTTSMHPTLSLQAQGVSPSRTILSPSLHHPANTSKSGSPILGVQELTDERLSTMSEQTVADGHDICAPTTRTRMEATRNPTKINRVTDRGGPGRLSRQGALVFGPTILDLSIPDAFGLVSSCNTDKNRLGDATTNSRETKGNSDARSKLPDRGMSIASVFRPATKSNGHLKRQLSSVDCPPESKRLKLERTLSHISSVADSGVEPKYQATEPASLRRAESMRSDISECSNKSTDSLFNPSPLSSLGSRSRADKDYPPTVPNTPLPDSVDYARSKANPMVRTIRYYRRRSLEVPPIPPVPIIAPPEDLPPTTICCREDYAIDRIKALLQRERGERERDGLDGCDEKRASRSKEIRTTEPTLSRRDSGNTSESSIYQSQWEDASTHFATESQETKHSVAGADGVYEQHRLATRDTWSDAFGITNDFRKEVTQWMLRGPPKDPVLRENPEKCRDKRPRGTDLYDQLINSPHTRFHAAQLFHRYFLLPDKVEMWREMCRQDCFEQELCEAQDEINGRRGIWALAVACIALAVKLHRDSWPPLTLISATEFIGLSPCPMTNNTFELAQRDVMYTFQFLLGTSTPQDILDELWNALPTLRKATAAIRDGWTVVQRATWERLFESLLEPDMLQYPVSLLTGAALVDGLVGAVAGGTEVDVCQCKASSATTDSNKLVENVILDVQDVLELSNMELDECRKWMSAIGK